MSQANASKSPLVSIIVPSYNQGRYIKQTIDSILEQHYRPLEVLIIDGASKDETVDILHEYDDVSEVTWISEPDSGVVEAVNKGFDLAKGVFAGIQSSDDYYLPNAIESAVSALESNSELGFVYGDIIKIDAAGNELMKTNLKSFSLENVLSLQTWIPQPSTFFRLHLAVSIHGWREEAPYAADTEMWLRMAFRAPARKIDQVMAKRRLHGEQRETQGHLIIRDYCRMLDAIPELKTASRRIQRAAAAGKLLQMNRYHPGKSYWAQMWRQWRAVILFFPVHKSLPLASLIPGWYALRRSLSRLKRMVIGNAE